MNKNIIQFIINENGSFLNIPVGNIKAKSNLTTRLQVVTPISASTAVNYLIYDSKNIEKKQYLIPTGELGSEVVDPNNPLYSQVASWKVYEADIYAPILSVISKYRTGRVGVSFEFTQQTPNALCTNFVDYFGFDKPLPEFANLGDYYICENYNFWLNDKLYNKGDILVWYGEQWNNGGILPKGLTETIDISVDPAISYNEEEVDETAFGNAIGELSDDVADLITITSSLNGALNGKQDKVDLSLETNAKTVVGGINELKNNKQDKIDNNLQTTSKEIVGAINSLNENINLITTKANGAVRFDVTQLLTDEQKERARVNIGIAGGDLKMIIVNELPETGEPNTIYLVPNEDQESSNLYIEWIYIGGDWEKWGSASIDLTDYYTINEVDGLLLEKLDKIVTGLDSGVVNRSAVYAVEYNNTEYIQTNYKVSDGPYGQTIMRRDAHGRASIADPTIDLNIANKKYVDDTVKGKYVPNILKDPNKTYLVVRIPTDNDEFTLLTGTTGSPNYTIEWGDGFSDNITDTSNPTHTYEKAGMYLITISGSFTNGIVVGDDDATVNKYKLIEVYGGNNYPASIGIYAFSGCSNLVIANFPNATSIGFYAFGSCLNLVTANFPNATSISSDAFGGCTSLTTATFPNVTSIDNDAFRYCTSLKDLTLGNVTTTVTGTRFENVKLDTLTISGTITDADITRIKTFFADNEGTFSQSYEIKYGLQVEKTPTLDNDVVRKIDLDLAIQTANEHATSKKYVDDSIATREKVLNEESHTIQTTDWQDLSSSEPYKFSATITATYTIENDTEVGTINDQPVLFGNYGFVVGALNGQSVTIYAVKKPETSVTLLIGFRG